jgi:phosphatidate cytidylyltransferase
LAASNLKVRLLTAAVVVPPLLWLLFRGPAWGFFLLVLVATAIAADELFRMTHPADGIARAIGVTTTLGVSVCLYMWGSDVRVLLTLLFVVPLLGLMVPLWRLGEISSSALRTFAGVTAPFYIGGLLCALALVRRDAGAVGPHYVFMCLTFAWLADTGGYFFGRFLGKRKLYEAVSPKKTRAGFVGALLGAELGGLLGHFFYLRSIPLTHVVPLALVAGALGQAGDLVESLLKRSTGIKDSGSIVPGHGGMLDRIDALIIVAPVVYLYILWVGVGG